jgi:hypothetical protein
LKYKSNLNELAPHVGATVKEGLSFCGVWTVCQIAKHLGIVEALRTHRQGRLALWQVLARVLEQGFRLSATRLGEI